MNWSINYNTLTPKAFQFKTEQAFFAYELRDDRSRSFDEPPVILNKIQFIIGW